MKINVMKHKKNGFTSRTVYFSNNGKKINTINIGISTGINGESAYMSFYSGGNGDELIFGDISVEEIVKLKQTIEDIIKERDKTLK